MEEYFDLFDILIGKGNNDCDHCGSGTALSSKDELRGKVAIVVTGFDGLEVNVSEKLLSLGIKVCLIGEDEEVGVITNLQSNYGILNVIFINCEMSTEGDLNNAWDQCIQYLGKVDYLINTVAFDNQQDWNINYNTNIGGATRLTLLAMERMSISKGGIVVNFSRLSGIKTSPLQPMNEVANQAIIALTRNFGNPVHFASSGVKVMCLCYGMIKTNWGTENYENDFAQASGMNNLLGPEVVCDALIKLLEENRNGSVLVLDGENEPYYMKPFCT